MHYLNPILLIVLSFSFILSCQDESKPTPPAYEAITIGSMEAQIGDDMFTTDNIRASQIDPDLVTINASAVTNGITFLLTDSNIGQYPIGGLNNDNSLDFSAVSNSSGNINIAIYTSKERSNATGTITIQAQDEINKTISGVFNAVLVLDSDPAVSIVIEEGLFNQIPY